MRWGAAGVGLALVLLAVLGLQAGPDTAPLQPDRPSSEVPFPAAAKVADLPDRGDGSRSAGAESPAEPRLGLRVDLPQLGMGWDPGVPLEGPPAQPVRISVVDVRGEVLPNARLYVETAEERHHAGRYGEAKRLDLPTGVLETEWYPLSEPVTVRAVHPYIAGEAEVAVSRRDEARDLRVVLDGEPRGALELLLVAPDAQTELAVSVSVAPGGAGRPRMERLAAGDTWLVGALVPGSWRVVGTGVSGNWRVLPQDVEIVAGQTAHLALEATAAPSFQGTVRNHAGELMPGSLVRLRQPLGLPGADRGAFPRWHTSWCPSDAVGAGTSVGGLYRAGVFEGEYSAHVIVAEDATFNFPGVTGAPFVAELVAAVTPDGRIYRSERDPAIPRDTRTRGTVVVRQAVVPGQEPSELRAPARAAAVEFTLAGEFADARGVSVYVDGAMHAWKFVEKEGRRLRLAAMDLGTHSVLVRVYRGYNVTSAFAVTEVECRPGETTRQTLQPIVGADLTCEATRGPGVKESTGLCLWYFWRGRPLMQQQVYWDSRKHNDAPAGIELVVRLDAHTAGELLPTERQVRTESGSTHDFGPLLARARPEVDRRWWLMARDR